MSDPPTPANPAVPDSVREIVRRMVVLKLAECDRLGIDWDDFYRAILAVDKTNPDAQLPEQLRRAMRRVRAQLN